MATWEMFQRLATVKAKSTIVDPDMGGSYDQHIGPPAMSQATKDPDRLTIYVPYDHTTLSLGNRSSTWIHDVGITGRTDNHIHFWVRGEQNALDNTVISLGGPASSVLMDEFEAGTIESNIHGYAMITSGDAWHESKGKHYIVSREGEVTLRTAGPEQGALVQSDTGAVNVLSGGGIMVGTSGDITIGAWPDASIPDERFTSMWMLDKENGSKGATAAFYASKAATYAGLAVVTLNAMRGIALSFPRIWKSVKPNFRVPKLWPWLDIIATVKDIALTGATLAQAAIDWEGVAGSGKLGLLRGNVSIQAEKYAGMYSGVVSTIYGHVGTYLYSSGTADMIGLISTSMSGVGYASMWAGVSASMAALGNTSVSAEFGGAEIKGRKSVSVTADVGGATFSGNAFAQMTSTVGPASLVGATRTYVGAGVGAGFGMTITGGNLKLGQLTCVEPFSSATVLSLNGIGIQTGLMKAAISSSEMKLSTASADLKGPVVNVEATGVTTVKGSMVLLG